MQTSIRVRCDNQVISYVEKPFITSGDVNEDRIDFEFCHMWDGLVKTAVFYRSQADVYHVLLDADDSCVIPHEVLKSPGPMYFGVFGNQGDRVKTSDIIQYTVRQGAITEATKVSDPTPDVYAQIIDLLIKGGAASGGTSGKDGKNGVTFTPSVDAEGNLSWTNDGGLENPDPVNIKGKDGKDGADGKTPIKGVDYFDGKDGANGKDGADGKTPVKGKDYWTEADLAAMVSDVIAALPVYNGEVENA